MRRFSASQLAEYLQTKQPQLIDVREPWEFKLCHIEGSELLPLGQIPTQLERFHQPGEYVIICHHGIRSVQAIHFLQHHNIQNLINLDGGVNAWAREVDPHMPLY